MRLSILPPVAILFSLTPTLARIATLTFPSTAYIGEDLDITATEEAYPEAWTDLGVLFGFVTPAQQCGTCVGQGQYYENLFDDDDYEFNNGTKRSRYNIDIPVARNLNSGSNYIIMAAVNYVVGESGATGVRYFNSSITLLPQRVRPNDVDDDDDDSDDDN